MNRTSHLQKVRIAMAAAAMGAGLAANADAATVGIHFRYAYQYGGVDYIESTINTGAAGLVAGIPAANWNNMAGIDEGQHIYPTSYTGQSLTSPGATGVTADFSAVNSYQTTYPIPAQSDPAFPYVSYLDDTGAGYSVTLHGLTSLLAPGTSYQIQALQSSDNATSFADVKVYQGTNTSGSLLSSMSNPTTGGGGVLMGMTVLSGLLSADEITIVGNPRSGTQRSTLAGLIITTVAAPGYATWVGGFVGLADATPAGDPDGDGIKNLMEYVLNGNPGQSSMSILPTQTADASNFIFTFTRREESANDTTQVFESSTDLAIWTPLNITAPTDSHVTIGAASGGLQTVTISIPKGANTKLFGRLKASK